MTNLRAAFKFVYFLLMTISVYASRHVGYFSSESEKLRWRAYVLEVWAKQFVWLANCRVEVVGKPPLSPFLLVSNHLSYFDIAVLRSVAKGVFVAKADVEQWAVAGTICKNMGTIFINRENRRDIPRAGNEIVAAVERGEGVFIFAEGTSSDGKQVLPFKSSFLEFAAARGLPVHYAAISYETPLNSPPASESVAWWRPETEFAPHLFNLFKLPRFNARVSFGANPIHNADRKKLTAELHQAVSRNLISSEK